MKLLADGMNGNGFILDAINNLFDDYTCEQLLPGIGYTMLRCRSNFFMLWIIKYCISVIHTIT